MSKLTARYETGQSLVIIALLITALLVFLGVLIDGGLDYSARRQGQNAADAAALAGVRVLAKQGSSAVYADISTAVITYSQANFSPFTNAWGGSGSQIVAYFVVSGDSALTSRTPCDQLTTDTQRGVMFNGTVPANAVGVRTYVTITFQAFLMGILNPNGQVNAGTCATAIYGPAGGTALPIFVPRCYADPNDSYNERCKKNLTDDPTMVPHVILGKVSGNELFNGNQLDAIANFNNRVAANPVLVPPAASAWSSTDFDANYVWGPEPCDFTYSSKQAASNYIDAGGYGGQCGPLTNFGAVAPVLTPQGDWVDLIFGVSGGTGGPQSYKNSPHPYNPGDSILVVLYQECKSVPQRKGDPPAYPPLCEAVDSSTGQTSDDANGKCTSNCRAKLVGRAWMKIMSLDSNKLVAIFDPNPHALETCVDWTKCGTGGSANEAFAIQLVP